jgi:hypothetical protein
MKYLSRRNLVAGAAALPALAVPAVASFSPDHPDAKLLRLAPELEVIAQELEAANEAARKISEEWDAACDRAGLLPEIWWPEAQALGMSDSEWWKEHQTRHEKRNAIPHGDADQTDADGITTIWDKLNGRLNPLVDKILAMRATTVDGLRVQAHAVATASPELFDDCDDCRPEVNFARAVLEFVGVRRQGQV